MEKKNIGDFQIWKLYKIECKLYSIIYINQMVISYKFRNYFGYNHAIHIFMIKRILQIFNIQPNEIQAINYEKFYSLNKKNVSFIKYYIKLKKENTNKLLRCIGFEKVCIPI